MKAKFRPEIEGLRGIAVLSVVLFHAGIPGFGGGYVGVDVFFVISGFLITLITAPDIQRGSFSFSRFCEGRMRRLLPAMLVMIAACIPFALCWMPAAQFTSFSASVSAACLFVSNLLFWSQAGYFDSAQDLKPLLHSWSLGVEVQFYLSYILLLYVLLRRVRRGAVAILAILAVASFALSEFLVRVAPSAAFYLLPARAWEMLAGCLSAFLTAPRSKLQNEVVSAAGLVAICVSVFTAGNVVPPDGAQLLLTVLGTCAVLACAQAGTVSARLLGFAPLVAAGAMSYSIYLWHQPILAFARIRFPGSLTVLDMLALIALAIGFGYLSWRFVERPARRMESTRAGLRQQVLRSLAGGTLVLASLGVAGSAAREWADRFERAEIRARLAINTGLGDQCEGPFKVDPACATSDKPEVLLWGDSFAMHLLDGLRASNPDIRLVQFTQSVCGPFTGIAPVVKVNPLAWSERCIAFNDQVLAEAGRMTSLRYAVLSSPFTQFVTNDALVLTRDGKIMPGNQKSMAAFRATLEGLRSLGITPIIFAPPPRPGFDVGTCLAAASEQGRQLSTCDFPRQRAEQSQAAEFSFLREIEKQYPVIWLTDAVCETDTCRGAKDGIFIYRDAEHLSREGSALLGRELNFYQLLRQLASSSAGRGLDVSGGHH